MEHLRRLYNAIDVFFDWAALIEKVEFSQKTDSGNVPVTARQAYSVCQTLAMDFDRKASLKLIVSPDDAIQANGTATKWEFFFDLPQRRAQMIAVWYLPCSPETGNFEDAQIDVTVNPFPAADSTLRKLVKEGKLLHKQLVGMWRKEYKSKPPLPRRFRDSDEVMAEFAEQGLDIAETEVTLIAECKAGESPLWRADARGSSYYAKFMR